MTRHLALLAYPDCQLLDVCGPWQVFASANALSAQPLYHLTLVADSVGPLMTNGGLALQATHSYQRPLPRFPLDTLLVAGGSGVMQQRDTTLGLATMCIGMGQGVATVFERLK